jgi:hypothetical protein
MHKIIFTIFLSIILVSCTNPTKPVDPINALPIDSFSVSGIDIGQQADNFQYINDTTLCSYDLTDSRLVYFQKNKSGNYSARIKKQIDTEFWSMYFKGDDNKNYFIDGNNVITVHDPTDSGSTKKYKIVHKFKFLKDSFGLALANNTPIIKRHDTIIAVITPISNTSSKLYFKEQEMAEFKFSPESDTLRFLRSYITKPSNLSDYDYPIGSFCLHNNTVYLMYPSMDTIYSFDRTTGKINKTVLNNHDFRQPDKFYCQAFSADYGSCATKYYLNNFRYNGIYFNPVTKHFVVFYNAPVVRYKGRVPVFSDQPLKAIILDEKLNVISYQVLNKQLGLGSGSLVIPGKGLAMPIMSEKYETTQFYIYNF